jgi:sec-independent protein translocase protein TatA
MFLSHMPELLAVLVIGLVVFGPKRLPEIGSSLGQGIRELKKGVSEITDHPTPAVVSHPRED